VIGFSPCPAINHEMIVVLGIAESRDFKLLVEPAKQFVKVQQLEKIW